jgi:polysaccharide biosynthesis protein PslH
LKPVIAYFAYEAPFPPPLNGGQRRMNGLIREFTREFDVVVVCFTKLSEETLMAEWPLAAQLLRVVAVPPPIVSPDKDPLWGTPTQCIRSTLGCLVPGSRPAMHKAYWSSELVAKSRELFAELPVEAVWAYRSRMAEMARAAGARRVLVDIDDFDGELMLNRLSKSPFFYRKPLHLVQAAHWRRYERRLASRFDAVAVGKREDLALLAKPGGTPVQVVPNGIDVPETRPPRNPQAFEMLFVGTLAFPPNVTALTNFVTGIFPEIQRTLPQAMLTVAGRGPVPEELGQLLRRPGITLNESPASLAAAYERACICVAPLDIGGGTSIKVLEALAHGVPVVATSVGARGLGLRNGVHLEIADSNQDFARACVDLMTDRSYAQALAEAGAEEVNRRFCWEAIGVEARAALHGLVGRGRRQP